MVTKDKLDITTEEFGKIKEALKKQEFRDLLAEYAEELADPVKRQQYEEELTMLESQRGVDMKFIKPEPGFVLKLNDSDCNKVFVNICTSPNIDKPDFAYKEQTSQSGQIEKGQQVSLPYSLSPVHLETDNKGVECPVYDVVFHPEVLARCPNSKFKDIVVSSALEGLYNQFQLQLNKESVKFPKLNFKGTPSQCVIRKRVAEEKEGTFNHLPRRPDFPNLPGEEQKKKQKKEESKHPSDEPDYKIVYRNDVDMGNFTNDRITSSRPTHLILTISLPLHKSTRDVELDVYATQLELHSQHYNLLLTLPYTVDSERGSAKFDKEKQELVVTLEIVTKEIPRDVFITESSVEEIPDPSTSEVGVTNGTLSDLITEVTCSELISDEEIAVSSSEPSQECTSSELSSDIGVSDVVLESSESSPDIPSSDPSPEPTESSDPLTEQTHVDDPLPELTSDPSQVNEPAIVVTPCDISIDIKTQSYPFLATKTSPDPCPVAASSPDPCPVTTSSPDTLVVGTPPQAATRPSTRFNVSPVRSESNISLPTHLCELVDEPDPLFDAMEESNSLYSSISGYTNCSVEDNLSVNVRVYQDMATVTVVLDTVYNSTPTVTLTGKTMWLKNEDVELYVIMSHSITTYTIHMNEANVCLVLYKQHPCLWTAIYIGHCEEEVFSFKFITEESADRLVESFGDPWLDEGEHGIVPEITNGDTTTTISYTMCNKPNSIQIESPDSLLSDDPLIKSILKSPHSPPPMSPRSRKVSFNEEVETFVLPSKRSLKGKRKKKKNGSNSASESSDDMSSSPSPISSIPEPRTLFADASNMKLASANNTNKKKPVKPKETKDSKENKENKEGVLQSAKQVVQALDPSGSVSHKMSLSNPLIYELDE